MMKNNASIYAKGILGFSVIAIVIVFLVADVFNELHLFNPEWPPHARFHNGMQFTTLVLMSLVSFGALLGRLNWRKAQLAALTPITFWPDLLVAWFIPGTSPYASMALEEVGIPINVLLAIVFIALTLLGLWLAHRTESRALSAP